MFEYELALSLGMPRERLLKVLPRRELTYWMAFYKISPWGAAVRDRQSAMLAWVMAATHSSKDKVPSMDAFMISKPRPKRMSTKQMANLMRAYATKVIDSKGNKLCR